MKAIDFATNLLTQIHKADLSFTEIQVLLEIAAGRQDVPQIALSQEIAAGTVTAAAKRLERLRLVRCICRTPGVYHLSQDGKDYVARFFAKS